jgi:hypothetical protein
VTSEQIFSLLTIIPPLFLAQLSPPADDPDQAAHYHIPNLVSLLLNKVMNFAGRVFYFVPSAFDTGSGLTFRQTLQLPSSGLMIFGKQRIDLLLGFASTAILGFGPRHHIFSFQNQLCVLKWGLLFDEESCFL